MQVLWVYYKNKTVAMSLKEIQSKLLLWEASENPLAPLTSDQREAILDLESLILGVSADLEDVCIITIYK